MQRDEPPGLEELIGRAKASGRMRDRPGNSGPTLLGALGAAQLGEAHEQYGVRKLAGERGISGALGVLLIEAKAASSSRAAAQAVVLLEGRIERYCRRRPGMPRDARRYAQESVRSFLFDLCPACGGRGVEAPERFADPRQQASKSERPCIPCGGSGRMPSPSDRWRRVERMNVPERFSRSAYEVFEYADGVLDRALAFVLRRTAAQLERYIP